MKKLLALVLALVMIVTFGLAVLTHNSLDYADQGMKHAEQIDVVNIIPLGDPWPPPDEG